MRKLSVVVASLLALSLSALVALPAGASSTTAAFPKVSGKFGTKPTLTFPSGKAPKVLAQEILHHGTGPKVKKSDLLVVNYLAQIWGGKVFDSSYGTDPGAFPIGVGLVITGWDKELINDHIGDRVVLDVPPADGYGSSGDSSAGISGTDTLVFVVDLVSQYAASSVHAQKDASKVTTSVNGITVTGSPTSAPKIKIAKDAKKPTKETATLLYRGTGPKVGPGVDVMQVTIAQWSGSILGSTWSAGYPTGQTIDESGNPSYYDSLDGFPIGSRVLLEVPKNSNGGPYALVVDIGPEAYHGKG